MDAMKPATFIKLVCGFAAAVDGWVALGMLFPVLLQPVLRVASVPASAETRYALDAGAALMLGWTLLLIWTASEPSARRTVLLLTIAPVIAGLALATLRGFRNGYIPLAGAVPVWSPQAILAALLSAAFRLSPRVPRRLPIAPSTCKCDP